MASTISARPRRSEKYVIISSFKKARDDRRHAAGKQATRRRRRRHRRGARMAGHSSMPLTRASRRVKCQIYYIFRANDALDWCLVRNHRISIGGSIGHQESVSVRMLRVAMARPARSFLSKANRLGFKGAKSKCAGAQKLALAFCVAYHPHQRPAIAMPVMSIKPSREITTAPPCRHLLRGSSRTTSPRQCGFKMAVTGGAPLNIPVLCTSACPAS